MSEWIKSIEEAPPRAGVPIDFIIKSKNSTCLKRYTDCHPILETDWLTSSSECENFNEPDITTDWRTKQSVESGINPFGEL